MSYQVIARKFRPQKFDELIGQNHVSQTLLNALKADRLHHALLLTGPRGTGKTTTARIIAKSLRCPNAVEFVPCNQCDICEEINHSRSIDVIEIDGASNNGVDAIRELRDGVAIMPSSGKYKVYIIDEVHMLSTSAFNALLKTLEEPPSHVVFILATTEVHKIPATILSRCQRYDFRRIPTRESAALLKSICAKEHVEVEEDALWMLARLGDGSMRDSISLLDQLITFSNGKLSKEKVIELLGLSDQTLLLEVLAALIQRDLSLVLSIIRKLTSKGIEPLLFTKSLLQVLRDTLMIKISAKDEDLAKVSLVVDLPETEIHFLQDLSASVTEEDLHLLFDMTLKGVADISRSSEPTLVFEMLLLRMACAPRIVELKNLLSAQAADHTANHLQKKAMPKAFSSAANSVTSQPQALISTTAESQNRPTTTKPVLSEPHKTETITRSNIDAKTMGKNPSEDWYDFVGFLKDRDALLGATIEPLPFLGLNQKKIELALPNKLFFLKDQLADTALRKKIQTAVEQFYGAGYAFDIKFGAEPDNAVSAKVLGQQKEEKKEKDLAQQIAEHPKVKMATAVFKAQVKSIK